MKLLLMILYNVAFDSVVFAGNQIYLFLYQLTIFIGSPVES